MHEISLSSDFTCTGRFWGEENNPRLENLLSPINELKLKF